VTRPLSRAKQVAIALVPIGFVLYAVFWFIGLSQANEYGGRGSDKTELWLDISFAIESVGAGALVLIWAWGVFEERRRTDSGSESEGRPGN